jgi:hypothetical protein
MPTGSGWVDDIASEIESRRELQTSADELRLNRLRLFRELGPLLFQQLMTEVRRGCGALAELRPECASLIYDAATDNLFTLRNLGIRPSARVTTHLNTSNLVIRIEKAQSAIDPYVFDQQHRVDFTLDSNDQLAFCMECSPLDISDVLRLIVRPLFGLPAQARR